MPPKEVRILTYIIVSVFYGMVVWWLMKIII